MTSALIIVVLAVLLIIGFIRLRREKNQEIESLDFNPVQEETPYVVSQEHDNSNYSEVYEAPQPESLIVEEVVKKSPVKKSPVPKESKAKKTETKKSTTKKTTTSSKKTGSTKKSNK